MTEPTEPEDEPRSALEQARALRDALLRAEAMIGLLSVEAAERLPGLYAAAAAAGATEAWRELGDCWAEGIDVLGFRPEAALDCYARAQAAGDPGAPEALARLALRGWPEAGAAAWAALQPAVAAGEPRASLFASFLCTRGLGVEADPALALRLAMASAEGGAPEGMFEVHVLLRSAGAPTAQSTAWCAKAAALGHPRALYNLAVFAAIGEGRPVDLAEARARYAEAAAAGSGPAAQNLARMRRDGEGGPVDLPGAEEAAQTAAALGYPVPSFEAEGENDGWDDDEGPDGAGPS